MFGGSEDFPVINAVDIENPKSKSKLDPFYYLLKSCGYFSTNNPSFIGNVFFIADINDHISYIGCEGDVLIKGKGKDAIVYQWKDEKWIQLSCLSDTVRICKGKDGCEHLVYKEECTGNSYVDSCPHHDKKTCMIIDCLRDEIDEIKSEAYNEGFEEGRVVTDDDEDDGVITLDNGVKVISLKCHSQLSEYNYLTFGSIAVVKDPKNHRSRGTIYKMLKDGWRISTC